MRIKDIKNREIKTMALLNASKDFGSLSKEKLGELELIQSFYFTEAEYPKNLGEDSSLQFWKKVLLKEESEALKLLNS